MRKVMNKVLKTHMAIFKNYARSFCDVASLSSHKDMLELKIEHTEHVVQHMQLLVQEKSLAANAKACLLAALYHDIGRFEQFSRYKTFKDALSVNHATLGAKILYKQGFLKDEDYITQKYVLYAVATHNRYALPKNMDKNIWLITTAVRDADKLDILRIMADHFTKPEKGQSAVTFYAKDEPTSWSNKIVQDLMQNRLASYDDIVYINDFKLLLGSWVHDIYFTSTKKALMTSTYLEKILQDLPHNFPNDEPVQLAKAHIFKLLKNSCA